MNEPTMKTIEFVQVLKAIHYLHKPRRLCRSTTLLHSGSSADFHRGGGIAVDRTVYSCDLKLLAYFIVLDVVHSFAKLNLLSKKVVTRTIFCDTLLPHHHHHQVTQALRTSQINCDRWTKMFLINMFSPTMVRIQVINDD